MDEWTVEGLPENDLRRHAILMAREADEDEEKAKEESKKWARVSKGELTLEQAFGRWKEA